MNVSTLYPPNFGRFDDVVIGSVLERVRPTSHMHSTYYSYSDHAVPKSLDACSKPQPLQEPHYTLSTSELIQPFDEPPAQESGHQPEFQVGQQHKAALSSPQKRHRAINPPSTSEESMIELRRRRRRANMQRYRNKIQHRADTLDQDVQQLRARIHELELKRETILARAPSSTVWSVTAEYFRLFRQGLKEPHPARQSSDVPSDLLSFDWSAQSDFLFRTMAPDVIGQLGCGVDNLLQEFQIISRCLPILDTQLVRLDHGDNCSIVATTKVEVIITSNALRLAFPHLVPNGEWTTLATTLLDKRFFVHGSTRFEWDNEASHITVLQSKLDLVTPMLKLLGDLENVARVFDGAAISLEGSASTAAVM